MSLHCGVLRARTAINFSPTICSMRGTKKSYYRWATYKDQILTVPQWSATFLCQETSHLNAIITMRSTYNESCKICPRRTQATRMRAHKTTWATACPLCAQIGWGPRRSQQIESLEKDKTLYFLVWHKNGSWDFFLMHVMGVLDAIKKHGTTTTRPRRLMRKPRKQLSWWRLV